MRRRPASHVQKPGQPPDSTQPTYPKPTVMWNKPEGHRERHLAQRRQERGAASAEGVSHTLRPTSQVPVVSSFLGKLKVNLRENVGILTHPEKVKEYLLYYQVVSSVTQGGQESVHQPFHVARTVNTRGLKEVLCLGFWNQGPSQPSTRLTAAKPKSALAETKLPKLKWFGKVASLIWGAQEENTAKAPTSTPNSPGANSKPAKTGGLSDVGIRPALPHKATICNEVKPWP